MHVKKDHMPPYQKKEAGVDIHELVLVGLGGAFFAGVATAAAELRKNKGQKLDPKKLTEKVGKEALGTGLAATIGTAVGGSLFRPGFLSYSTMAAVALGVKYAYDGVVESLCSCSQEKVSVKKSK